MKRTIVFYALSALFTLAVGCGSNQAACEDYVDSYNKLECVGQKLDTDEKCPDQLDDDECDMESYYKCLSKKTTCADGGLTEPSDKQCSLDCDDD
jgi:hypothetical protein